MFYPPSFCDGGGVYKSKVKSPGLTQNITIVGVIHELPLHNNQGFANIVRKS